jgi:7-cyano-7-deazaguanine synthase
MPKAEESKRCILLLSGGIDSTILGLYLNDQGINYQSLFINYGQTPNDAELNAVTKTAALLRSSLDVIEMHGLRSAFTSSDQAVFAANGNPGKHVLELGSVLLLAPALTYARRLRIDTIYIGYTRLDADYSDEYSQKFLDTYSDLSTSAGYPQIVFKAPFVDKTKDEVLQLGSSQPNLLAATWTCHLHGPSQCGVCESCLGRRAAFAKANIEDPTDYEA